MNGLINGISAHFRTTMFRATLMLSVGLLGAVAVTPAQPEAAHPDPGFSGSPRLQSQELRQAHLQRLTGRVDRRLSTIIDEFERNGLTGIDVRVLKSIDTVLENLTLQEMSDIVESLSLAQQQATSPQRHAVSAFVGQKSVLLQLHQIQLEYQRQLALNALSLRFQELGDRQTVNLHDDVAFVFRKGDNRHFSNEDRIALRMQQTEQHSLNDETAMLLDRLASMIDGSPDDTRSAQAVTFAHDARLVPIMQASLDDLDKDRLMSSAGNQRAARDALWLVGQVLAPNRELIDQLRTALTRLDTVILDQRTVITWTSQLPNPPNDGTRDVIYLSPEGQRRVAQYKKEIERHTKNGIGRIRIAAKHLRQAEEEAQRRIERAETNLLLAREEQDDKRRQRRVEQEQRKVDQVKRDGERRVTDARRHVEEETRNKDRAIANAERGLQRVIDRESGRGDRSSPQQRLAFRAARRQAEAADKTDFLARTLRQDAKQVADLLASANDPMQHARMILIGNDPVEKKLELAPPPENLALRRLAAARALIIDAIRDARAARPPNRSKQLEELRVRAEELAKQQRELLAESEQAFQVQDPEQMAAAADAQEELTMATEQLNDDVKKAESDAVDSLTEAIQEMQAAKARLTQSKNASQAQENAANRIEQAARELGHQADVARAQEGFQNDFAVPASWRGEIAKAQQQIADAIEQLQQPAGQLTDLQKRQQLIADGLAKRNPANGSQQAEARQRAQQAANELAQGNSNEAIKNQQATQDAIAAAQSAGEEEGRRKEDGADAGMSGTPSLPDLAAEQAEVQELTERLAEATQAAVAPLEAASETVAPLAAEAAGVPTAAQSALAKAAQAINDARGHAGSSQPAAAEAQSGAAQNALAQAAAALSLAQSGLAMQQGPLSPAAAQAAANSPGQSQTPGPGAPGPGQSPSQSQGPPSPNQPSEKGTGEAGNFAGTGGADGARRASEGSSSFIGLPRRERDSARQSFATKYSAEYADMIEQYLRNLSDHEE